ncbi:F0F1 ATP synthase subunit delta [Calidifontibacillus erzurumensis]|uniref:ATP synthase subunit delta n=1 Tax=Calidifontibacillus erzurumensis TaxID=2741433 RepID=A0A8J8GGQ3_9BACI|nr:F0F1 ATP synthase subunit delta [Calidifontibacillus erzurumensis]NSL52083.1 F0F1 ATP synthase subunit delta [Calidifontibacillus erzurumensis]
MSQNAVASRYALALYQLAKEQNLLEQLEQELKVVEQVLNENPKFLTILKHPKVSKDAKKALVKDVFKDASQTLVNTILLLIDRKREDLLLEIAEQYFLLANEARGIAEAKVYSVRPLTADEEQALSEVFAKKIGKSELRIKNIVDNSLIGGIKLRIGNTIYDGSVKGKLERIERQLLQAK